MLREGNDITLVSYGSMISEVLKAAELMKKDGIHPQVIKINTITPLPTQKVFESVKKTGKLLVAEDCVESGCVGQRLAKGLLQEGIPANIALCNTGNHFTTHGSVPQLYKMLKLDGDGLYQRAKEVLRRGQETP